MCNLRRRTTPAIHGSKRTFANLDKHKSREMLQEAGIQSVVLPPRSPNLNAHIERFFRSLKSECLSKMILFGGGMLRRTVLSYLEHYHQERNHQGLENRIIQPGDAVGHAGGEIQCRERLGGLLRYYCRDAA